MNKWFPYILIGIAVVSGFYLKQYLDLPNSKGQATEDSDNKIINQFDSLLIYPKKNSIQKFSLTNHEDEIFMNDNLKGKWNLIFSGYTNCPDVCPNTLTQMTQLYQLMDQETRNKFQFIFLSVDPERDTPEHIKQYLDYFHKDFIGITGDFLQIDILIKSLGGIYSINKEEGEYYTVDHSARIFIVGPKAERYGILESAAIKSKNKNQLVKDLSEMAN